MAGGEAELGEGRGVGEALEDAIKIARVAEVFKAERRGAPPAAARVPCHLQTHQRPLPRAAIVVPSAIPLLLFDASETSSSRSSFARIKSDGSAAPRLPHRCRHCRFLVVVDDATRPRMGRGGGGGGGGGERGGEARERDARAALSNRLRYEVSTIFLQAGGH